MSGTLIFLSATSFAIVIFVMTVMTFVDAARHKSKRDAKVAIILSISCALSAFASYRNYDNFIDDERNRERAYQEAKVQRIKSCKLLPELEDRIVCLVKVDR